MPTRESQQTSKVNTDVVKAIEQILTDRPVAFHPILAKALHSATAGIFLSQPSRRGHSLPGRVRTTPTRPLVPPFPRRGRTGPTLETSVRDRRVFPQAAGRLTVTRLMSTRTKSHASSGFRCKNSLPVVRAV